MIATILALNLSESVGWIIWMILAVLTAIGSLMIMSRIANEGFRVFWPRKLSQGATGLDKTRGASAIEDRPTTGSWGNPWSKSRRVSVS